MIISSFLDSNFLVSIPDLFPVSCGGAAAVGGAVAVGGVAAVGG